VKFKTPFGWQNIESLSYGYQTMICWLVDLTRRLFDRYPDSVDPLSEPAIVLVDEIDLHLHPKWQREVMDYLSERFTNTQFIVTAHSPLIIQNQRAANVILLKRIPGENGQPDRVEVRQDLDEIKRWRADQILTSDLFGLATANGPEIDTLEAERDTLLEKEKPSAHERQRLAELDRELSRLPSYSSHESVKAEQLLREAAQALKSSVMNGKPKTARKRAVAKSK
jgi:hypothetical protein